MTEPKPPGLEPSSAEPPTAGGETGRLTAPAGEILQGRDETTPLRALSRVWLVVAAVAAVVIGIAFGLWAALA
jgi:hypothetical protein